MVEIVKTEFHKRDIYFDNIKFYLILLVAAGHIFSINKKNPDFIGVSYTFIYSFHIYAFAFVSGYFSKIIPETKIIIKNSLRLFILYSIFYIAYYSFARFTPFTNEFSFNILKPYWMLWYIIALWGWRILLPFILKIKMSFLWILVIILILDHLSIPEIFSNIFRIINFFPYFLAGYLISKNRLQSMVVKLNKKIVIIFMILTFTVFFLIINHFNFQFYSLFWGSQSFTTLGVKIQYIIPFKIATTLAISFNVYCLLAIIPTEKKWYSNFGRNTLYAYLFHGFFVKILLYFVRQGGISQYAGVLISTILIILIIIIFSTESFKKILRYMIEPF